MGEGIYFADIKIEDGWGEVGKGNCYNLLRKEKLFVDGKNMVILLEVAILKSILFLICITW